MIKTKSRPETNNISGLLAYSDGNTGAEFEPAVPVASGVMKGYAAGKAVATGLLQKLKALGSSISLTQSHTTVQTGYEKGAYQFLSVYRFLAYALAIMFTQIGPQLGMYSVSEAQTYWIITALGIYTLLRVFSPLRWREKSPITFFVLGGDLVLCMTLVLFTGGLNSVFLLYSLVPVITAALLFEEKASLALAAVACTSLSLAHLAASQFSDRIAWIMQGHNLTLLIVYTLFCFVAALIPYRINLNVRRRIEWEAIVEERRRIGREIHDTVAQSISYINFKTKLVEDLIIAKNSERALVEIKELHTIAKDTFDDIRESIDQLSTENKKLSLEEALANYIKNFGEKNDIQATFENGGLLHLSSVAELQLLRIVQETLTNVRKHARATRVQVTVKREAQNMIIVIADNGQGFNPSELSQDYHGLTIMKERAESLGGSADIISAPGKGTQVKIILSAEKVRI